VKEKSGGAKTGGRGWFMGTISKTILTPNFVCRRRSLICTDGSPILIKTVSGLFEVIMDQDIEDGK
jgi:hypothetical protein